MEYDDSQYNLQTMQSLYSSYFSKSDENTQPKNKHKLIQENQTKVNYIGIKTFKLH